MTAAHRLRLEPRFGNLMDHLHVLGGPPLCELLLEPADRHGIEAEPLDLLEQYGTPDPAVIATVDAGGWRPLLPHKVS